MKPSRDMSRCREYRGRTASFGQVLIATKWNVEWMDSQVERELDLCVVYVAQCYSQIGRSFNTTSVTPRLTARVSIAKILHGMDSKPNSQIRVHSAASQDMSIYLPGDEKLRTGLPVDMAYTLFQASIYLHTPHIAGPDILTHLI